MPKKRSSLGKKKEKKVQTTKIKRLRERPQNHTLRLQALTGKL